MPANADSPIYSLSKESVFRRFQTSDKGLDSLEVKKRLDHYGPNKLTEKKAVSPLEIFAGQFKNLLIIILLISALLTFLVYFFGGREQSDLIEGGLILAIVIMIVVLGFIQEYRAEKAIEALKKLLAFKAKVVRDGKEQEIDTKDLVPGDIVILEEGEKVPADIRLFEVASLQTNEASLTGESTPVNKIADPISGSLQIADQKNMVFSSTVITNGRGKGVVIATGDHTEIGKIATAVSETQEEETPIQKRLEGLGKILGYSTLVIAGFVFLFIVFFSEDLSHLSLVQRVLHSFIASVALAVAAIPEGLPAVVTISLAFGTQRMLKRNALVRKLASMETLGSVDVIAADKTGTLTSGQMTVREIYQDGKTYSVTDQGYEKNGGFELAGQKVDGKSLELLLITGLLCNNASVEKEGILGDPTEAALIVSARKGGLEKTGERIYEIPFSSERKMMSVVVKQDAKTFVYSKGAAEILLSKCTKIIKNGVPAPLDQKEKNEIIRINNKMAENALRVLGFAYKEIANPLLVSGGEKEIEESLVFIGLQGMMDPPRNEVKELISKVHESGIRVIMITGDHLATAKAIATEIGIREEALTGSDLEKLSSLEFAKKVEVVNVYARVNPEHKFKIVEALKKKGHLVAMTGDGVNDAPALKRADIGVAMGITGTDVSKEASDMVLLDDKFATIVAAIEEGRGIFDNIRKFVDYLLSCNVGEVLVVFFALILFKDIPLTAVMLLWINVVTDGLPAIALGLDPAEKGILRYKPKRFQGEIINVRVWGEIIFFGLALTVSVLVIYYLNLTEGIDEARAAAFMAIVVFELVRLANIRSDYKISWLDNIWLPIAIFISLALQFAIVYIPALADLFEIAPIDAFDWVYIFFMSGFLFATFKVIDKLLDKFSTMGLKKQLV